MIPWIHFVGKLSSLMVEQLPVPTVEMTAGQRHLIAQSCFRLSGCLVELEGISRELLKQFQPLADGKKDRIFSAWLHQIGDESERVKTEWGRIMKNFAHIYRMVGNHYIVDFLTNEPDRKRNMLRPISSEHLLELMRFEVQWKEGTRNYLKGISLAFPREAIMSVDLHRLYVGHKAKSPQNRFKKPEPSPFIFMLESHREIVFIDPENIEAGKRLHDVVLRSLPALTEGRKALQNYIREYFTLEDMLYVKED